VKVSEDVEKVFLDVKKADTTTNWALFGLDDQKKPNAFVVKETGTGGLSDFTSKFTPDVILFAVLKVTAGEIFAFQTNERAKLVFITHVGNEVSGLQRARVGVYKSELLAVIKGCALEIHEENVQDLTEKKIFLHG